MKKFIILSLTIVSLYGCSAYRYSSRQISVENHNITASPTVVDVEVDYSKRIVETSRNCLSQFEALQEAKYNAIVNNNIDILVDMIYKVEQNGTKYRVTVTGYAGYYKNSRSLYDDINLLGKISKDDIEKYIILHAPAVVKYMNEKDETVNIYHNESSNK